MAAQRGTSGRSWRVAVLGLIVALLLTGLGAIEYFSARREFGVLVRAQAASVRDTVAAAARANRAAAAEAETELAERLLDNARLLSELDRGGRLTPALLQDVAARHALFRVTVLGPTGRLEGLGTGPGIAGPGGPWAGPPPDAPGGGRGPGPGRGGPGGTPDSDRGPRSRTGTVRHGAGPGTGPGGALGAGPGAGIGGGPATAALVEQLLAGDAPEGVTPLHAGRRTGVGRLAAGVRRQDGGAILVSVDATEVAQLQQQSSLDRLLDDIVAHTADLAYVVFEQGATRRSSGDLPRDAADRASLPGAGASEREVMVGGQPVLEITGPIDGLGEAPAHLRLGMRLDGVRRAERRTVLRLATTLTAAMALGVLAVGLMGVSRRYGHLSVEHARAQEALRRRDRLAAMGELASTVAHEIRNPLNAIAMGAQRLRREWLEPGEGTDAGTGAGEEARSLVDIVEREARRLNGKIQQFLEFARPPALAPRPTPLRAWLAAVASATAPLAAERGVAFAAPPAVPATVVIDPEQLRQALENVLRNAIEATPAGGTVALSAEVAPPWLSIDVRDGGPGIPPEDLPRIFDLYYTTKPAGTGVGLALTQQIVAAHGGRIDVDTAPGTGTTMHLRLPLEAAAPDA